MSPSPSPELLEALASRIIRAGNNKATYLMPFYMGAYIDSLLLGALICQMFRYYQFVKVDRKHIVALAFLACGASIAASFIILLWVLRLFVWQFGSYLQFSELLWLGRYVGVEVATILFVQIFYVDRACRLFKSVWPALVIGPFVMGTTAIGITALVMVFGREQYITAALRDEPLSKGLVYAWLSSILFSDLLITVVIVYGLRKLKTGWSHTDSVLQRMIKVSFESQLPALLIAIISLIVWAQRFETALAFVIIQSKFYALSLLFCLNIRATDTNGTMGNSYQSRSGGKISSAGPMERASADHTGYARPTLSLGRQGWLPQHESRRAGMDDLSEIMEDKEYGSTASLT